ncbi:MAG: taurine ABC transporter substrate-binding protein [Beijerinckiaceae bacterium]
MKTTRLARFLSILTLLILPRFATAADPGTLRLAYQTGDINTLTMYADAAHLFESVGLKVSLVAFPAGPAILPAMAAGEVDVGWMGEFPIVTGFANGVPLTMIMVDRLNKTNTRLVARNGTGIEKLADIKGKKIAVSIGSTSHQHVVRALKTVGLKQEDVTLVNLSPANMPAAYQAGQIDAAFTWEPNISLMEKNGKVIATTESIGDITGVFLAARTAFLKEHPELVQKFLAAWKVAMTNGASSPDDVRQYEAKRLGISVPEFSAMLERMGATYPTFQEQLTQPYLGAPGQVMQSRMMTHLQDIGDFLISEKRINALPKDWSGIIDTGPLQAFVAKTN